MRVIRSMSVLAVAAMALTARAQMAMPTQTTLQAGVQLIQAEVASTEQQRETGLMMRRSLPGNHGMLFVFERPQRVCMWMKDTLIPLSVAFIDSRGAIIGIADMKPGSLDAHCSAANVPFALEMPQGWFASHGVPPGTVLRGVPFGTAVRP